MSLVTTNKIHILFSVESLDTVFGEPQVPILRSPQREDAWCYAACTQMVIETVIPEQIVQQCEIASFVKQTECCNDLPGDCTDSGCQKNEISSIFTHFQVAFEGSNFAPPLEIGPITLDDVRDEIEAQRPVMIVIDWAGGQSSHAVLINGVIDDQVHVIDPLPDNPYGGWHLYSHVLNGFSSGQWDRTWHFLRRI